MSGSTQKSAPLNVTSAVLPPSSSVISSFTKRSVTQISLRRAAGGRTAEGEEKVQAVALPNLSAPDIEPNSMQLEPSAATRVMLRL